MPVNSCVLIRVQPQANANSSDQAVVNTLRTALGNAYAFRRTEVVGPKVSDELKNAGILATVIAVFAIGAYVAVRFEWQYGIAAIVATGHDVFVTAGLYSLLHLDFTLTSVAALLTLAGYSVNDTVVVFDRIRENRRRYKRMPLKELINLSTNQTLTRTVLTSITTSLSIIPLLLFGGPTLFDFTAAILFGIVVGTFSSIYVAAALLIYLPPVTGGGEPVLAAGGRRRPVEVTMNKHADIEAEEGTRPTRTSELLREFARSLTSDRVTLAEIVAGLGDRGLGVLIAIFALPNILPSAVPFGNVPTGLPPLIFAIQLALGVDHLILPRFLARRTVGTHWLRALAPRVASVLSWFERLLTPRMEWVTGPRAERIIGVIAIVLAMVSTLPIPFGHNLPALGPGADRPGADRTRRARDPYRRGDRNGRLHPFGLVIFGVAHELSFIIHAHNVHI